MTLDTEQNQASAQPNPVQPQRQTQQPLQPQSSSIIKSRLNTIIDKSSSYEERLKTAEKISDDLLLIATDKQMLELATTTFCDLLETTEPQFIAEEPCQKLRKLTLDMIYRLPASDSLRDHVTRITKIMFRLFEIDNSDNVFTALRIIVELTKLYKPQFIPEIYNFLENIKNLYSDAKKNYNLNTMFEEKRLVVKDLNDPRISELLASIHTITTVELEIPSPTPQPQQMSSTQIQQQSTTSELTSSSPRQGVLPSELSGPDKQQGSESPQDPDIASTPKDSAVASQTQQPNIILQQESTLMIVDPPTLGATNSTAASATGDHSTSLATTGTPAMKQTRTISLLPKANQSIRMISEMPIIVVLLYQMNKTQLQPSLEQLLPLVLELTLLRPPENIRQAIRTSDRYDKDIYVDFVAAQIKCLSFVSYLVRIYSPSVLKHHPQLIQGLLNLLIDTPHEVVSIRKELLAASRHIFLSDLREKFMEQLHILCNDEILVGPGWNASESIRPSAYSILVELLSNYKGRVKLKDLSAAYNLFAKNLHDTNSPAQVQLLSCKAFNSIVQLAVAPLADEKLEQREFAAIRDLLMRIIAVYVLKFKNISQFHLPLIWAGRIKAQQQAHAQQSATDTTGQVSTQQQVAVTVAQHQHLAAAAAKYGAVVSGGSASTMASSNMDGTSMGGVGQSRVDMCGGPNIVHSYSTNECKVAIRSLVIGVKTAIEAIPSCRVAGVAEAQLSSAHTAKLFNPKETIILVELLEYGLKALDIFPLAPSTMPQIGPMTRQSLAQATRGKEEKELLENFASIFTDLHPITFHEIFSTKMDFLVDRTRLNVALLAIVNFIISARSVSPIFSTILSQYLIERMEHIGSNDDLSNLYLRMFKMVFASVTLYPIENEQMLKPMLHNIVNKSVELALSAKEPYNYFLLLRALFRSIGGGSHDQLYAEFLPLLPNLLQNLNSFQSGHHKQHMKDLFTELCLTVPVRLSSLMPFMPTLIYPLVSALNGPDQLVSQGLRTLELCVDNLTPDYVYDLLQPVRADLMQGLWKTVRHPSDQIAQNCLRVLGKFGGNNRRMLIEPQSLTYVEQKEGSSSHGTTVIVHFSDQKANINLPIDSAVLKACETLKLPTANLYYKEHSWNLIRGFLVASIGNSQPDHSQKIKNFFSNPNLASAHIPIRREYIYKCPDEVARSVYQNALVGAMMAASIRQLRHQAIPFLNAIVRHHVMLSVGQHLAPQSTSVSGGSSTIGIGDQQQHHHHQNQGYQGMDPFVLVDALTAVISMDDKDLCKPGYYMIVLMVETATMVLGTRERACELPLINYLVKSSYELCYKRAWFAKMGGCIAIRFFNDNMPLSWLFKYLPRFVRALFFVMSDLTGELSSGAVDMAQTNLERLLALCAKPITTPASTEETILAQAQATSIQEVMDLLIKQLTSQHLSVRTHTMKSIELIAKLAGKSVSQVVEPQRDTVKSTLPFLERQLETEQQRQQIHTIDKQPVRTQIGIIHAVTFCTNLEPKVFTLDTNNHDHKFYVDQLIRIAESDEQTLKKLQCYANVTNLAPVRSAALQALASLHYLTTEYRNTIFKILFKSTESSLPEVQDEAYKCITKFTENCQIDTALVQDEVAPLLMRLKDSSLWNKHSVKRLICIGKLFNSIFNEQYCLELLDHFIKLTESATEDLKHPIQANEKVYERAGSAMQKLGVCAGIIELLSLIQTVPVTIISKLMARVFKIEGQCVIETGSPLRAPLKQFLRRFPEHTISLLLTERNLHEQQVCRFLKFILHGKDGRVFRNVIGQQSYFAKLIILTTGLVSVTINETDPSTGQMSTRTMQFDLRYHAIFIISIMIKQDKDWLLSRAKLVDNLQQIWCSEEFYQKHNKVETTDYVLWKEPKMLVKCLLNYFQMQTAAGNKDVIELLFQLLRVFFYRNLCDFEFFRLFIDKTVIETYSIEWKREAFAKFLNVFHDNKYPQPLKAKILQYIIIPSFSHSFEKGLGEALLGGPPQPERENPNNLIHVFINKIIDPMYNPDTTRKLVVSDSVRILLLQFSCLLVDKASAHIHESSRGQPGNKKGLNWGSRLKKLITFACPSPKTGVDPAAKHHGHLLLSHIIAKFPVPQSLIDGVFHSLLKACTPDARQVVRQALDILLPAISQRLHKGNAMLLKWTKKIIIEEGHTNALLIHTLTLLIRHHKLYYPVRTQLMGQIIDSIQKLSQTNSGSIEHRKTAVDLCEVVWRWEIGRQNELRERQAASASPMLSTSSPVAVDQNTSPQQMTPATPTATHPSAAPINPTSETGATNGSTSSSLTVLTPMTGASPSTAIPASVTPSQPTSVQAITASPGSAPSTTVTNPPQSPASQQSSTPSETEISNPLEPLDQRHVDSILNALIRLACLVNPGHCDLAPSPAFATCKTLSDRCTTLIKRIIMPESWGGAPIVAPSGPNLNFSGWMGELLCTVENQNYNVGSISGSLELLTYLCGVQTIRREVMLANLRDLSKGIIACTQSHNSRIIRSVSNLVQRVMNVFPPQSGGPSANVANVSMPTTPATPGVPVSQQNVPNGIANSLSPSPGVGGPAAPHEELEPLYSNIHQVIITGLNMFENHNRPPEGPSTNPRERDSWQVPLFSSLMLLKAACINNPAYIDRVMPTLIRVIQKMTREHVTPVIESTPMSMELLILGLDLVKNRLGTMSPDLRKTLIQQILSHLIESQTSDVKVLKAVVRIVEDWMRQKQVPPTQGPNLREKTLLLIKLMLFIEKRFPTEPELNSQFLELIYYVYKDDELKTTDLTSKLESAFMAGLRCVQPSIRQKFFTIYDQSVKPKLYERLMFIVCAQNWQQIGCHFWIQQCIEFILAIATPELPICTSDTSTCLSCIPTTADLGTYNPSECETSTASSLLTMLSNGDTNTILPPPDDVDFVANHDQVDNLLGFVRYPGSLEDSTPRKKLQVMINRQVNFLDDLKKTRTGDLLRSLVQLCHMSVDLAKSSWIEMFPRIWRALNDQQMTLLGREIIPFLCSGAHVYQRDCNPSAVGAFMEAVSRCHPPIYMRPILIKYLGKNHNIWHRSALMLEDGLGDKSLETLYPIPARSNKANQQQNQNDFDIITLNPRVTMAEEALESISDILELLQEHDLWSGLWQRKAHYEETKAAVLYEQKGLFVEAQEQYEAAMDRQRIEFDDKYVLRPGMKSENRVWEKHWIRCTKELNQWDSLLDYGTSKACTNPLLIMESAWRVPNWAMMKEALVLVEENCPPALMWRLHLYKGYYHICNHENPSQVHLVDDAHHVASSYCIQTWKKLPHIITNAHLPLLQAAQQLLELNEAKSLHLALYGMHRNGMHELRTILKAWPKRSPILLDDLSYWSDIHTWRQHQYQTIVSHFETQAVNQAAMGPHAGMISDGPASVAMQGAHFSAQGIINFGTVARKQGLLPVCLEVINRIHTIPSVPIYDCYQKIRQQVKSYLQMPISTDKSELLDGIEIIECTNLQYFQREYVSEFYTYKGIFLSRLNRLDEANKAFSAAAQLNDQAPKAWSAWGEYLEQRFTQDFLGNEGPGSTQEMDSDSKSFRPISAHNFAARQMDLGVSAVTCYLQACKFYNEPKARKYLAKVLWLLSFDSPKGELLDLINKYSGPTRDSSIPAANWIVWIPQILQCLMLNPDADCLKNLLISIGKHSPQAVFFPVRTLLLTLKVVFANRLAGASTPAAASGSSSSNSAGPGIPQTPGTPVSAAFSGPTITPVSSPMPATPGLVMTKMEPVAPTTPVGPNSSNVATGPPTPGPIAPSTPGSVGNPMSAAPLTPIPSPLTPKPSSIISTSQPTLVQQLQQPPTMLGASQGVTGIVKSAGIDSPGGPLIPNSPQNKSLKMRAKTVGRCNEIVRRLYDFHPTAISSLEAITDQMIWLKDYSYEEIQRQIQQALTKCYVSAFENSANIADQTVSPQTLNFVRKLVNTFGVGGVGHSTSGGGVGTSNNSTGGGATGSSSTGGSGSGQAGQQSLRSGYFVTTLDCVALRNKEISKDPEFQQTRIKFRADFEESLLPNMKLIALIGKLRNWIKILGEKKRLMPKSYLMEDKCRFLSNFSQHTADVEIPGDALMPKHNIYYVRIARFIPEVKVVEKHNTTSRRILIRGHNGKIYPYLVLNDSCLSDSRREERVLQMLRLLNQYLVNKKETGRRYLQFTLPRVVAISPGLRLVEDNPSSLSLLDILRRRINHHQNQNSRSNSRSSIGGSISSSFTPRGSLYHHGLHHHQGQANNEFDADSPVTEYYDRLIKVQAANQTAATPRNLRDICQEVSNKMVPRNLLKEWASSTYPNATDYWVFRSQLTYQLAIACLCEYAFHLTRLMPENLYIQQDTGRINVAFFKFDIDDSTGELRSSRPVPFRLTPNLVELITQVGVIGPFRGALDAISQCLTTPQSRVISIFRAILRDEMLFWQKRGQPEIIEGEVLVSIVNRAVNKIYQRLNAIASNENPLDGQAPQLIQQATSADQLALMDPAWHPWL